MAIWSFHFKTWGLFSSSNSLPTIDKTEFSYILWGLRWISDEFRLTALALKHGNYVEYRMSMDSHRKSSADSFRWFRTVTGWMVAFVTFPLEETFSINEALKSCASPAYLTHRNTWRIIAVYSATTVVRADEVITLIVTVPTMRLYLVGNVLSNYLHMPLKC